MKFARSFVFACFSFFKNLQRWFNIFNKIIQIESCKNEVRIYTLKILFGRISPWRESNKWVNIRATDSRMPRESSPSAIESDSGPKLPAKTAGMSWHAYVRPLRDVARDQWCVTASGSSKVRRKYNGWMGEKGETLPFALVHPSGAEPAAIFDKSTFHPHWRKIETRMRF